MIRVVGLGAGGHAKVMIDILQLARDYEIVGLLDADETKHGSERGGVRVLGGDALLGKLLAEGVEHAFVGVGSVGSTTVRARLYSTSREAGFKFVPAIHPAAIVSRQAQLGDGPSIMAGAIVNAGTQIGDNVIINTGAIVEHDCRIGDHAHVATGACLAGGVSVGTSAHIGAGSVVRQNISIGENAVVGAGSTVVKDVPANVIVMGVPAKFYKRI